MLFRSNLHIIRALVSKDLSLFFRNRFIAVITVLGIVAYLGMYFAMPGSVDETLEIAFYAPVIPSLFDQMKDSGLELRALESERAVKEAVKKGEYLSGIVLPMELMQKLVVGQKPTINLYFGPDVQRKASKPLRLWSQNCFTCRADSRFP